MVVVIVQQNRLLRRSFMLVPSDHPFFAARSPVAGPLQDFFRLVAGPEAQISLFVFVHEVSCSALLSLRNMVSVAVRDRLYLARHKAPKNVASSLTNQS